MKERQRHKPERAVIEAVHDDDLEDVLEALGLGRRLDRGELRCAYCGQQVDRTNLNTIFSTSGAVKVSCDRPDCALAGFESGALADTDG